MKLSDMLAMSLKNLWQRKTRTVLTVLGVVIGVASIVVMISLGIGLQKSTMEQIENFGGLTTIMVNTPYNNGKESPEDKLLSDATVERLKGIEHVKDVYPQLNVDIIQKFGRYYCTNQLQGLPPQALKALHLDLKAGDLPQPGGPISIIYGNAALNGYMDLKSNRYPYYETGKPLDYDLMAQPVPTYFDTEAFQSTIGNKNSGTSSGTVVAKPKKYMVPTAGVLEGDPGEYNSASSWKVFCDLDSLMTELKKIFRNKPIPGQPLKKNGRPYKQFFYSQLQVDVDEMQNVTEVQKEISDMGLEASSDVEYIKQQQQQINMIQAVLGGIGAVSLLVAAIGIANTMMMSIYERIREIGIMKVIGCNIRDIGALFLIEAAYIGLFGGFVGLIFSYAVSAVINHFGSGSDLLMMGVGEGAKLSIIPPWLALVGVVFAVFIGMLSGFVPSQRAMRLSALAAIKNE